ncbi:MAG TPA: hypothetical protein H9708_07790 [Candidatus Borkfalkia stercoripullorum]|nr:hypothetical protein [Candidatus Borkfalkia stercoripullorum]
MAAESFHCLPPLRAFSALFLSAAAVRAARFAGAFPLSAAASAAAVSGRAAGAPADGRLSGGISQGLRRSLFCASAGGRMQPLPYSSVNCA